MSSLDALLGNVWNDGVPVELGGGLDVQAPLQASNDPATKRIKISIPGMPGVLFIDPTDRQYGAVGTGVADDKASILLAIEAGIAAGLPVNGRGKTYGIRGDLTLPANTWLEDISFKQLDAGGDSERRTLVSNGASNIRLVRVVVDRNGSGEDGELDAAAGIWIQGGSGHHLEDVEVFGDDKGNGLTVWGATKFDVVRLHVHDVRYLDDSNPGDDQVQGFWFNLCSDFRVIDPRVHDLGGDYGAGATTRFSRNAIGGCTNFEIVNAQVQDVDQGVDLTGNVGNTNFRIIGGCVKDCLTFGWKFANSARGGTIVGATAEDCGASGFVVSGPGESLPVTSSDLTFVGCTAYDTGSNGQTVLPDEVFAFRVGDGTPAGVVLGIRFIGCKAIDRQAVKTMLWGFTNATPANTDGRYNEAIDCVSIGHVTGDFYQMHASRCEVSRVAAQSIPTSSWTEVSWTAEVDSGAMHSTSVNAETVFARRGGKYRSTWGVVFAANATGQRGLRILFNGNVIPGTTVLVNAAAAGETAIQSAWSSDMNTSNSLRIEVWQSSGGNLDLQTSSGGVVEQVG